jgi:DNA-binding CsgD family transcriptional regulator
LRHALNAFCDEEISKEEGLRWLGVAAHAAGLLWDYEGWNVLSARHLLLARDAGALGVLPIVLNTRAGVHLFAGELAAAASLVEQVEAVMEVTGSTIGPYGAVAVAAFRGRDTETTKLIEAAAVEVESRGEGEGLTFLKWATAVLHNGLGRYADALAAAKQAGEDSHEVWFATWGLVETIEAATRSGHTRDAVSALDGLSQSTAGAANDWAGGVKARSQALLSDGETADALYRQAIDALGRTRLRVELARAHLLYGEWLRRQRQRLRAREQLRSAYQMFTHFGMEAFAERARVELAATGERARKRSVETRDDLTPQEANISRLVADGATNQEIAAQLFISPSTVEYHLRKAFRKVGARSRTQLARHMIQGVGSELAAREL